MDYRAHPLNTVQAIAFDLDGTLYLQGTPLPGAIELLQALRSANVPYVFMTNNSSVSKATYLDKLTPLGGRPEPNEVLTSNDVMLAHLQQTGLTNPYLVATAEVREEYAEHGIIHTEDDPDSVVLTFDMELTFQKIADACRFIVTGVPYLATHPDVTCPIPNGFLPDTGSFIEMFAAATGGYRPEILGKPAAATIRAVADRLGATPHHIAFVGDRLTTDIQMGNDAGFISVLTLTGVTQETDLKQSPIQPSIVVDCMETFTEMLQTAEVIAG